MSKIDLPDVNVWIALSGPDHEHREIAVRYWRDEASERIAFNSITMLGLTRICSNAPLFAGKPLSPTEAWAVFEGWSKLSQVIYLPEPNTLRNTMQNMVGESTVSKHTWTDSYLAAFAIGAGHRLVSFDNDFKKFHGLNFLYLKP